MTGVAALTLWQPWASLIPAGAKTIETRGYRTRHRGRLLIHASNVPQREEPAIVALPAFHDALWPALGFKHRPMPATVSEALPRGRIVGSAEVVDCVPILGYGQQATTWRWLRPDHPFLWLEDGDGTEHADDQLAYGDFAAGRWGWMLADAKPTTERCPWCWGERGDPEDEGWSHEGHLEPGSRGPCPVCDGAGTCAPIPARGMPGLWRWSP